MKKLSAALLSCALLALCTLSCTKESVTGDSKNPRTRIDPSSVMKDPPENISVSDQGFLVFPSMKEVEHYSEFLATHTHSEVQDYLQNLNFTSRGASIYAEDQAGLPVTGPQEIDYVLSAQSMVQVSDIIMKPVQNNGFLLAMTSNNLTPTSLQFMTQGVYNPQFMNKFATNPPGSAFADGMFAFMISTPTGHQDVNPNPPPAPQAKFWGSGNHTYTDITNGAGQVLYTRHCWHYYMFWIDVGTYCEP